jgi:Fe2+ transport system protein B
MLNATIHTYIGKRSVSEIYGMRIVQILLTGGVTVPIVPLILSLSFCIFLVKDSGLVYKWDERDKILEKSGKHEKIR